ncbi:MAG: hypothetical protein K8R68_03835 [Bacteroidales bacterium]|nr:hypothetical protein [Bacteroidales bacterium]
MNNTECDKDHRHNKMFTGLPYDQGGLGRHKCAGCAYELGYKDGLQRREKIHIDLDNLPFSQASVVRHKSPHAAYAKGYYDGVGNSYK